ncbi:MAG: tetratricopeptide repeat protein [Proteobacteria bacterium]|nr:tetratricopeptide repeat protein [Pseudomonadota bacterium]MBU1649272.1 tetratricopeptide repeat protein [Pseudomonadota bacterium]
MNRKPLFLFFIALVIGPGWVHAAPGNAATCEKNASTLAHAGKLDEGLAAIRQCIADDPSQAKAHIVLGDLLLEKGDLQQAMVSFDKALELQPRSSAAKTGKGIILAQNGDLKAAEAILLDALKLNPNPAQTHYELGLIYEKLGDIKGALSHFKQGISSYEQEKGR